MESLYYNANLLVIKIVFYFFLLINYFPRQLVSTETARTDQIASEASC